MKKIYLTLFFCTQIAVAADQVTLNKDVLGVVITELKKSDQTELSSIYNAACALKCLKMASKQNLSLKIKLSDFYKVKNASNIPSSIIAATLGKERKKLLTAMQLDQSFPSFMKNEVGLDPVFTMLVKSANGMLNNASLSSYFSEFLLALTKHQEKLPKNVRQAVLLNTITAITDYYKILGNPPFYVIGWSVQHPSYSSFIDHIITDRNFKILLHVQNALWPLEHKQMIRIKNFLEDPTISDKEKSDISYFMSRAIDFGYPSLSCSVIQNGNSLAIGISRIVEFRDISLDKTNNTSARSCSIL